MAALRRGIQNAIRDRTCAPCRQRRHTDCEQAASLIALQEFRASGFELDEPQVVSCECYRNQDIHHI